MNITKYKFEKILAKRCAHLASEADVVAVFNILIEELKEKIYKNKQILFVKNFCTIELKKSPIRRIQNVFTKEYQYTKQTNKISFRLKKSVYKLLFKYLDKDSIEKA